MATTYAPKFGTFCLGSITSLRPRLTAPCSPLRHGFLHHNITIKTDLHRIAAANSATVYETLTLLKIPDSTDDDAISDIVDKVWSLQYLAAGPVCACAGPLSAVSSPPTDLSPPFTHAVLFRYGQERNMQSFLGNPHITEMLERTAGAAADAVATLCFQSTVPNELEAIFRRGSEWDEGVELIAALNIQPGSNEADAADFLDLTQQLATSSAFGAVQATSGKCSALIKHFVNDAASEAVEGMHAPDRVLLVRFQGKEQVTAFLQSPPIAALLEGDERVPLKAAWVAQLQVAPAANSNSSPQRGAPRLP